VRRGKERVRNISRTVGRKKRRVFER